MAASPLFIESMAVLRSSLRLTGAAQPDAQAQIDAATVEVRMGFVGRLGSALIQQILLIPYSASALTETDIIRVKANTCELKWIRMLLLRMMPVLFMDTSGANAQIWNEESLTRNADRFSLQTEIDKLQKEVSQLLDELAGEDTDGPDVVKAMTIGPVNTPPRPGDSVWGGSRACTL